MNTRVCVKYFVHDCKFGVVPKYPFIGRRIFNLQVDLCKNNFVVLQTTWQKVHTTFHCKVSLVGEDKVNTGSKILK